MDDLLKLKENEGILTLIAIVTKRVEYSHSDVDQTGQVEGDAPPQRDMTRKPEQSLISCTNGTRHK